MSAMLRQTCRLRKIPEVRFDLDCCRRGYFSNVPKADLALQRFINPSTDGIRRTARLVWGSDAPVSTLFLRNGNLEMNMKSAIRAIVLAGSVLAKAFASPLVSVSAATQALPGCIPLLRLTAYTIIPEIYGRTTRSSVLHNCSEI